MAEWCDATEGDTYFTSRHGVSTLWSDLTTAQKTALLTTAQADIESSGRFKFTDDNGDDLTVSQSMKDAVCEQALARLLDSDLDLRSIVQAQGVQKAGQIGEDYSLGLLLDIPLSPKAIGLLADYRNAWGSGSLPWSK